MWYSHTTKYYSAIKRKYVTCYSLDEAQKHAKVKEARYDSIYMTCPERPIC